MLSEHDLKVLKSNYYEITDFTGECNEDELDRLIIDFRKVINSHLECLKSDAN